MKEHWKYQGVEVPKGFAPEVDGKRCYRFRCENIGYGSTTLVIPIEKYWSRL